MPELSATEVAQTFKVSKGRVSQWLSEGKLDGCYSGEGRARRFDADKVAAALGRRLDPAQGLGNGARTRKSIQAIRTSVNPEASAAQKPDTQLPSDDPSRYELARAAKAEEELRRLRRDNALAEGTLVLRTEVERATAKLIAQELAEFETVLRDGARRIADTLGVDFKAARQILIAIWREHRTARSQIMADASDQAESTDDERAADI